MSKNHENLDTLCPKCKGIGWYHYDEIHAQVCEACCPHDQGWWSLSPLHAGYQAGEDNACCKAGCGTLRRDL